MDEKNQQSPYVGDDKLMRKHCECGYRIKAPLRFTGTMGTCPKCAKNVRLPSLDELTLEDGSPLPDAYIAEAEAEKAKAEADRNRLLTTNYVGKDKGIRTHCPECDYRIKAPLYLAGAWGSCPKCKADVLMPSLEVLTNKRGKPLPDEWVDEARKEAARKLSGLKKEAAMEAARASGVLPPEGAEKQGADSATVEAVDEGRPFVVLSDAQVGDGPKMGRVGQRLRQQCLKCQTVVEGDLTLSTEYYECPKCGEENFFPMVREVEDSKPAARVGAGFLEADDDEDDDDDDSIDDMPQPKSLKDEAEQWAQKAEDERKEPVEAQKLQMSGRDIGIIGAVVAGALLIIGLVLLDTFGSLRTTTIGAPEVAADGPPGFFYNMAKGELIVHRTGIPAPFEISGEELVKAYVFACGACTEDSRFVGWIEKYTPEAREQIVEWEKAMRAGRDHPTPHKAMNNGVLVRNPKKGDWVNRSTGAGEQVRDVKQRCPRATRRLTVCKPDAE